LFRSLTRSPEHQERSRAPETGRAGYTHVRGDLQQSTGEDELVAPGCTGQRGYKQLHQARAVRRQTFHHTADSQRDAGSGRSCVHVPRRQRATIQEHTQRHHAQRSP